MSFFMIMQYIFQYFVILKIYCNFFLHCEDFRVYVKNQLHKIIYEYYTQYTNLWKSFNEKFIPKARKLYYILTLFRQGTEEFC